MRRLLATALLTLVGASFVAFGFMHLAPIEPARFMIGFRQGVREEQIYRLRQWYGLDDPIPVQYLRWVSRAVRGDFGTSVTTRRDVGPEVWRRLPWSLLLAVVAAVTAWVLAVPLAVVAAGRGLAALPARAVIAVGAVVPTFLVATLLVYTFAVRLTLIPILPPFDLNLLDRALWLGLLLPSFSLAVPMATWLAQRLHVDLVAIRDARYLDVARAKGASRRRVVWRHAVGVVTRAALSRPLPLLSLLFSGVVLVEEVFNWPGVGRSFTRALQQRDIPVMQGALFVFALVTVGLEVLMRLALGRLGTEPEAHAAVAARQARVMRPSPMPALDGRVKVAAAVAVVLVVAAVAAPVLSRFPPDQVLLEEINMVPSLRHWMGTDSSGRDLFGRLLFAGRTTLGIALGGAALAVFAGLLLTNAQWPPPGRWTPSWQALVHGAGRVVLSMPALALALAIVATAGRGPALLAGLFATMGAAAVVAHLQALQAGAWRWPFVEAAAALGAAPLRIAERHVWPHLVHPAVAAACGLVPGFILLEATLGFLGFSVSPTTPSWGTLLWRAREALHRGDWWLIVFPAVFLAISAWAYTTLADALSSVPPPTYVKTARLRLGREWGAVPAIPQRTPAARRRPAPAPAVRTVAAPPAGFSAARPDNAPQVREAGAPGVAAADVSGASSD
ncbi:MAG: ABC transporter permease subunit [Armatimonadota bacterium]|nr:ABC transporter permease subunit [Armatimonadota bacterium]